MAAATPKPGIMIRFAAAFEAAVFVLAYLLGWLLDVPPLKQMHVTWAGTCVGIAATGPLLLGMWWCTRSRLRPLRTLMIEIEESIVPLFRGASPHTLLLISAFAGLGEECLFRGVFQSSLSGWLGVPLAVVMVSVLFGLAHLITPTYALLAGFIGAYFGALTAMTGNLLIPVIAHALYDYSALTYLVNTKRVGPGN